MDELYRSYLGFLRSLSRGLESLTDLNEKKLAAAQQDDLMGLNELLNQEQAQALNFRGLELTRDKLLSQLGLVGVPMSVISEGLRGDADTAGAEPARSGEDHRAAGGTSFRGPGGTWLWQGARGQRAAPVHENRFSRLTRVS